MPTSDAANAEQDREDYLEYLDLLESEGADPKEIARMREELTPGMGMKILEKGGRVLDYLGGLARGTIAGGIEAATGREDLVDIEDVLKGQAPTTAEVARKLGVPEGGSLSGLIPGMYSETGEGLPLQKGGWADPTLRGTGGFVGDVALDPLTYLSLGVVPAAKKAGSFIRAATTPAVTGAKAISRKAGPAIYKSGLKAIDEFVSRYGKKPVSDVLMKYGVTGSAQDILTHMDDLGKKLFEERQGILRRGSKAGAEVDMNKAMAQAQAYVNELRASKDPILQPIADILEEKIGKYRELAPKEATQSIVELPKQGMYTREYRPFKEEVSLPVGSAETKLTANYIPTAPLEGKVVTPARIEPGKVVPGKSPGEGVPIDEFLRPKKLEPIGEYQKIDVIPTKEEIISLPRQSKMSLEEVLELKPEKYVHARGEPLPREFVPRPPEVGIVDVPRVPGVDPLAATKMKSSLYQSMPQSSWAQATMTSSGRKGQQLMAKGIKEEVEKSIERAGSGELAQEAARLKELNDELGRILTSKGKQGMEARKELMKNTLTSVDAPLAILSPKAAIAKKLADISKLTKPRTKVGKALKDFGESEKLYPGIDIGLRRSLIKYLEDEQ